MNMIAPADVQILENTNINIAPATNPANPNGDVDAIVAEESE